mmetsp:Transcript_95325/g.273331  ORF Transcript_95325/g.273331 Transcript_95325/m.273331 type:complete len:209 (-) Transcript_95325:532-1158(-)
MAKESPTTSDEGGLGGLSVIKKTLPVPSIYLPYAFVKQRECRQPGCTTSKQRADSLHNVCSGTSHCEGSCAAPARLDVEEPSSPSKNDPTSATGHLHRAPSSALSPSWLMPQSSPTTLGSPTGASRPQAAQRPMGSSRERPSDTKASSVQSAPEEAEAPPASASCDEAQQAPGQGKRDQGVQEASAASTSCRGRGTEAKALPRCFATR